MESLKKENAGFTLVEVAIVMVIIGLLIGGVLKGQAMIQNAKVKRVVKQADELRAAVMTFYDKYSMLPGDENNVNLPPNDGATQGNGNGQIDLAEKGLVFEDLKNAGIIDGDYDGVNVPRNAFGGEVYILWFDPGHGNNHYIRYLNLPWDVCLEIDLKYDDGANDSGSIRANEPYVAGSGTVEYFYMPL